MTAAAEIVSSIDWSRDQWKQCLVDAHQIAVESVLDFGLRIYEYRKASETVSGGSTFTKDMEEWLGMSKSVASRWCKIGEQYAVLSPLRGKLPLSYRAVHVLTSLTPDQLQAGIDSGMIHREVTEKEVKTFKHGFDDHAAIKEVEPLPATLAETAVIKKADPNEDPRGFMQEQVEQINSEVWDIWDGFAPLTKAIEGIKLHQGLRVEKQRATGGAS